MLSNRTYWSICKKIKVCSFPISVSIATRKLTTFIKLYKIFKTRAGVSLPYGALNKIFFQYCFCVEHNFKPTRFVIHILADWKYLRYWGPFTFKFKTVKVKAWIKAKDWNWKKNWILIQRSNRFRLQNRWELYRFFFPF